MVGLTAEYLLRGMNVLIRARIRNSDPGMRLCPPLASSVTYPLRNLLGNHFERHRFCDDTEQKCQTLLPFYITTHAPVPS